ncbi:hypothetical protein N7492_008983 [Penicillium capsulatum]|uniref:Uncharacterized protein n=1 Tax=Penicillium capsulatum TaxID=69766 RepID=A0A9W9HU26_9EURO|nr:hypothetical protein N7492_008983 [Penicillium capsulatum]
MASFLGIPPELRAIIINLVLCHQRVPPVAPSKSERMDFQDIDYRAWRDNTTIYNEQRGQHCPSNSLGLLLTNHLLWILDISVLNDYDLFPTWLSVPYITNHVPELRVNVRLFGHILSVIQARKLTGAGVPLGFHWSFYALLERFLRYGPVDEKKDKNPPCANPENDGWVGRQNSTFEDRDMAIGALVVDIQSAETELPFPPADVDYQRWSDRHFGFDRNHSHDGHENGALDELLPYRARPEWLAKYLQSYLSSLLSMSYNEAEYAIFIYERIGVIRFVVDGEVTEIDPADHLAKLRFTNPGHTFGYVKREDRLSVFWEWKRQTLARRERLGFPVLWPQDPESNLPA